MRGDDEQSGHLFSHLSPEQRQCASQLGCCEICCALRTASKQSRKLAFAFFLFSLSFDLPDERQARQDGIRQ